MPSDLSRTQRWELRRFGSGPRFVGGGGDAVARGTADALVRRGLIRPLTGSRMELTERGRAVLDEIVRAATPVVDDPPPATPDDARRGLRLVRGDEP